MKNLIVAFLKYFLFWLIYFLVSKIVFLLYNFELTSSLSVIEIIGTFIHGLKMDLSMTSYLMLVPGILLSFSFLFNPKILTGIFKIYTYLLLILITFINLLDLGLYPHWGTRVSVSAFDYIGDPEGVLSSITWRDVVAAVSLLLFYIGLFAWFYKRFIKESVAKAARQKWFLLPIMIFVTALLFIPIRGGLGTSPINLSTVSFSSKLYVNHSSYNFLWHFFKTVTRKKKMVNACNYFDRNEAYSKFNAVENRRVESDSLLIEIDMNNPPNVVLIILESFSNKVISSFGGKYGVCPNLDSICAESIIFPSFYASGNRSDRGMAAILGAYPSLLTQSIINYPEKSSKLTKMSDYFNLNGYWSSFYYGGDIDFYNLKSFVLQGEFKDIVGQKDFPKDVRNLSSWGAPDAYLFDRVLNEIDKPQPFFTVAYTLSSHTPYDVPAKIIKGESTQDKYLNSVAYTDSCLGDFIRAFKKSKYWDNSLIIITADHGHLHPGPTEIIEPATYRIPMIWTGGVIKKPATVNKIWGQPDLIPTLIKQFGWERQPGLFGHDVFSSPSYAFYMWDSGWGYVTEEGEFMFDQNTNSFKSFESSGNAQPDFDFAKSYLQVLHDDFLLK
ncbi:alkaline phosphatase family protein [Draconibacterium sp.]|jgi:phosphoglycerol transferase MdoB-like AlkP superfamily enzyme